MFPRLAQSAFARPNGADRGKDELPVRLPPKSLKKRRDAAAKNVYRDVDPEDVQESEPQRREKRKKSSEAATDPSKLMPPPPAPKSMPPPPSPAPFFTMPGSLFPRSESLMPEPIPAKYQRAVPRPRTPSPPPLDAVAEATETNGEGLEPPDRQLSESPGRGRSTEGRTERADDIHGVTRRSSARSSSQQSEPSQHGRESAPAAIRRSAKGKERAYDTSGETTVKGMEAELREAREDHARNAHERDDGEGEKDKRRIRMLEEEVARLRAQLALKTDGNTAVMPPPPPPPPPPLFRPPAAGTSSGGSTNFLASVRANLKPTAPPVEAPINGARTRKTGQPTFNVPSDKMAAFLREMKSVRLRRVGGAAGSMGPPSFPSSAAGDVAGEIPRSTSGSGMSEARRAAILGDTSFDTGVAARIFIGEKRKRDELEEPIAGPSKRRETTLIRPDTTGGSSSGSSSQSSSSSSTSQSSEATSHSSASSTQSRMTASDASLSHASRSKTGPQLRIWPARSTGTDITTPSLCSDTEDPSEDKPPDTPSDSGRGDGDPVRSVKLREHRPKNEPEIIDVDALETAPRRDRERSESPLVEAEARKDAFAKRPPASPMPLKSPAKPLPPARAKTKLAVPSKLPLPRRVPVAPRPDVDESDSDDPLAMEPRVRTRSTEQPPREELPVAGSSHDARDRSGSMSASASARSRSQSQAQAQSRSRSRSNATPATDSAEPRSTSQMTNHARRRLTLDEELRRAGDSLWRESSEERERPPSPLREDLESGQLVAFGTKSSKRGFLARGGAAGPPVFMGEGYDDELGLEEEFPSVLRSRSTSTNARSGGSTGLRRR
ncbi:hypothetical protein C8Q80DRAFT_1164333 [Daedaleopsis nitida]|nr:hypothetical protein C8Q80DRAFT_1164333 [Daedaleopsis nitida]